MHAKCFSYQGASGRYPATVEGRNACVRPKLADYTHRFEPGRTTGRANERMREILQEGMDLSQQARFYDSPHQMPVDLKSNRDVNSRLEKDQLHVILDVVLGIQRINDTYDADLRRYRELMNGTAKMPCSAKE